MNYTSYYGAHVNETAAAARIEKLKQAFFKGENTACESIFSSPGRAEILGNHTDHNHGLVIVAAISCDILAAVKKREDNTVRICSDGYAPIVIDLNDTERKPKETGTSAALTRGVAHALIEKGYRIGGFTAYLTSNVFKGAGVSSSAAYEVLIAEIFNRYYLDGALTPFDKAVAAQYAENVYFGKPCGLLDQSGIAIGSLVKIDFKDPSSPATEQLGGIEGYNLIITNTGGNHAALTPHYAAIRSEMEAVASFFGKKVLRDVPYSEFYAGIAAVADKLGGRAVLRALHFYEENERVEIAAKALLNRDYSSFLAAVDGSGISSETRLQNCMVPGETEQRVMLGLEVSRRILKNGAVRVHGGGFAGSILAVVPEKETLSYEKEMETVFGKTNVFRADVRPFGTAEML